MRIDTLLTGTTVEVTGRADKVWLRVMWKGAPGFVSASPLQEVDAAEIAAWGKVKGTKRADDIAAFLKFYPKGFYAERATALLGELRASAPAASVQAPVAQDVAPAVKDRASTTPSNEKSEASAMKPQVAPPIATTPSVPPSVAAARNPTSPDQTRTEPPVKIPAVQVPDPDPQLASNRENRVDVSAMSGRWRGDAAFCRTVAEITIETTSFHGWLRFSNHNTAPEFSGKMADDGTVDLKVSDATSFVHLVGKFPNLRIDRLMINEGRTDCNGSAYVFTRITPWQDKCRIRRLGRVSESRHNYPP